MVVAGQDVDQIPTAPIAKFVETVNVAVLLVSRPDRLETALTSMNVRPDRVMPPLNVPTRQDRSAVLANLEQSEMVIPKLASLPMSVKPARDVPINWLVLSVKAEPKLAPILAAPQLAVQTPSVLLLIINHLAVARLLLVATPTIQKWAVSESIVSKTKTVLKIALATNNRSNASILVIRWNATTDFAKLRTVKPSANALPDSDPHRIINASTLTSVTPIHAIHLPSGKSYLRFIHHGRVFFKTKFFSHRYFLQS